MGVHHAREWPSSEHAIEFAYDLLTNYGVDARTHVAGATHAGRSSCPSSTSTASTSPARPRRSGDFSLLRLRDEAQELPHLAVDVRRSTAAGACDDNPAGRLRGTDPNRNYGGLLGRRAARARPGPTTPTAATAPFSEPEVRNIRELVSARQVTNLITNHTYRNLVLRPPGVGRHGLPARRAGVQGARRGDDRRTTATPTIPSFGLYDTIGRDGGLDVLDRPAASGFTFEIGPTEFHPPYEDRRRRRVPRPRRTPRAPARAATARPTTRCSRATADAGMHSLITGTAPEGSTLKIAQAVPDDDVAGDRPNGSGPSRVHRHARVELTVPTTARSTGT